MKRYYKVNRDKLVDHTITIAKDAISSTNELAHSQLRWSVIPLVVETPRGLLFLLEGNTVWFWLPQLLFEGNGLRERVLDLARKHSIPIRTMKR